MLSTKYKYNLKTKSLGIPKNYLWVSILHNSISIVDSNLESRIKQIFLCLNIPQWALEKAALKEGTEKTMLNNNKNFV